MKRPTSDVFLLPLMRGLDNYRHSSLFDLPVLLLRVLNPAVPPLYGERMRPIYMNASPIILQGMSPRPSSGPGSGSAIQLPGERTTSVPVKAPKKLI